MGKASRSKRRASVSSVRRTRTNTGWYAITAIVVIIGVGLIFLTRGGGKQPGVQFGDHWHAALGVYVCDHWMNDGTGDGVWNWPFATPDNRPGRPDGTYAGLHSHDDGLIHMEPASPDEVGKNATVGAYFDFGGWKLSSTEVSFLGTTKKNGDKCGDKPGEWHWLLNGKVQTGNPAGHVLDNNDVVSIVFVPDSVKLSTLAHPPSEKNLPSPGDASPANTMPPVTTTTTTPSGGSSTTAPKTSGSSTSEPTSTSTP